MYKTLEIIHNMIDEGKYKTPYTDFKNDVKEVFKFQVKELSDDRFERIFIYAWDQGQRKGLYDVTLHLDELLDIELCD